MESSNAMLVYPNPTGGKELTVKGDNIVKISVINSLGQIVNAKIVYEKNYVTVISSSLVKGIYFLRILNASSVENTFQFVNN